MRIFIDILLFLSCLFFVVAAALGTVQIATWVALLFHFLD